MDEVDTGLSLGSGGFWSALEFAPHNGVQGSLQSCGILGVLNFGCVSKGLEVVQR